MAQAALAYSHPPVAVLTGSHAGPLPAEMDILHLEEPELLSTAVFTREDRVICRVYNTGVQPAEGRTYLDGLETGILSIH